MSELQVSEQPQPEQVRDNFYERWRHWQAALKELDQNQANKDFVAETVSRAIAELDSLCPYMDQPVYMSGKGVFPLRDETGNIVGDRRGTEVALGLHRGVEILPFQEIGQSDLQLGIFHNLWTAQRVVRPHRTLRLIAQDMVYFDMDATVLPLDTVEEPFRLAERGTEPLIYESIIERIAAYSTALNKLFDAPHFRALPFEKQGRLMNRLLSSAEKATQLRGVSFAGTPHHGYLPSIENGRVELQQVIFNHALVRGQCLGFTSTEIESLYDGRALRADDDFFEKGAGLCLAVEPDDQTRAKWTEIDRVLYIPTASQTGFQAHFYRAA